MDAAENPPPMSGRRRRVWDLFDFAAGGRGLEIGPLHRPMVGRDEADVRYVDVTDRDRLMAHYAGDSVVMAGGIPEVDYWLIQDDGRTLTLPEAVAAGAPFDWVMASHVVEHVPDLIGWLEEIAGIVVDGGTLVLVVPDRRYCFDVHRPPTTVGAMLEAHLRGDRRPSVRAVYDYYSASVDCDVKALWRGDYPALDRRIHSLAEARAGVDRTVEGDYVDCHVWLFSPASFLRQMHELRTTGMSAWVVETLVDTPRNDLEFQVVLRRLPRGADHACDDVAAQHGEITPSGTLPDWLEESLGHPSVRRLERRIARLEERVAARGRRLERLRVELRSREDAPVRTSWWRRRVPGSGPRTP